MEINFYLVAKGSLRACLIMLNHIYLLTYMSWIVILYPLKLLGFSDLFNKIESEMMFGLTKMITMWNEWAGYEVLEAGDDIRPCLKERTLVLVNHQAPTDFIMLLSAFGGWNQIIPNIMWIMDHFIRYSTVGIVSSIRKDFFILQGKAKRTEMLSALAEHIHKYYLPLKRKWLVIFPEGGFLRKRKANSQKYGQLNGLPHLEHVTIPREGALKVIMNELKAGKSNLDLPSSENREAHNLKYILDVTIGYPSGKPLKMSSIIFGDHPPCKIVVFYRLYPIDEVPQVEEGFSEWLLNRWVEKERILENYYTTGEFPLEANSQKPRSVKQDFPAYCTLHLIFIMATIISYNVLLSAFRVCFTS